MGRWCKDLALCLQVENLKEKLISQAQEVSRLRSELVRPGTFLRGGVGVSSHGHSSTSGCGMRDAAVSEYPCPIPLMLSCLRCVTSHHRAGGWISFADIKEECELCAYI